MSGGASAPASSKRWRWKPGSAPHYDNDTDFFDEDFLVGWVRKVGELYDAHTCRRANDYHRVDGFITKEEAMAYVETVCKLEAA